MPESFVVKDIGAFIHVRGHLVRPVEAVEEVLHLGKWLKNSSCPRDFSIFLAMFCLRNHTSWILRVQATRF
jgi:hypothetical protein